VVGRITEKHLSEADKTFPGIEAMYWDMDVKPATFLQLLWLYESELVQAAGQLHAVN
jgi:hypothetical protein